MTGWPSRKRSTRSRCWPSGLNAEITEIAYAVRPHQLDTLGLSKTIETMVRKVGKACNIQLSADIGFIDDAFPEATHIHLFRIVQEAVSNIVKHSAATRGKRDRVQGDGVGRDHRAGRWQGIHP